MENLCASFDLSPPSERHRILLPIAAAAATDLERFWNMCGALGSIESSNWTIIKDIIVSYLERHMPRNESIRPYAESYRRLRDEVLQLTSKMQRGFMVLQAPRQDFDGCDLVNGDGFQAN
ncbi:MAG: hypothetical protein ACYDA5_05545 [Vulcanimicrobiaceae bacterium]